jgi:voltage-gated potassium channel
MASPTKDLFRDLLIFSLFFFSIVIIGMFGYMWLEDWNWADALYMTFITISTVGFKEVGSLEADGRLFTIFIIVLGLISIGMLTANVTSIFVSKELLKIRKSKNMKKAIMNLKKHTILCGAGDTGSAVIKEFINTGKSLVVIEKNHDKIDYLSELYPRLLFVEGDATKDETLEEANIKNAKGLITALSLDASNLFVVISARSLNPDLFIVSRSVDANTADKLYKAGANYVISPNLIEGMRMAAVMLRPTLINFLEIMMRDEDLALRMEEVDVPKGSSLSGQMLQEAKIPQRTGLIVIAMKKEMDNLWVFNPVSTSVLNESDKLIVLGKPDQIQALHGVLKE